MPLRAQASFWFPCPFFLSSVASVSKTLLLIQVLLPGRKDGADELHCSRSRTPLSLFYLPQLKHDFTVSRYIIVLWNNKNAGDGSSAQRTSRVVDENSSAGRSIATTPAESRPLDPSAQLQR
jgi:hypothetical protein